MNGFFLSALVDFPDDCVDVVYTPESIDAMVAKLKEMGVKRLYWQNYGDIRHGGFWEKGEPRFITNYKTLQIMNDPNKVAIDAAHRHGLEFCMVMKPYEHGVSMSYPEGSQKAKEIGKLPCIGGMLGCVDTFVQEHPEMRIARRKDDIPDGLDQTPVTRIELYKYDDSPTRIKKENIEIWVSELNVDYKKLDIEFGFTDEIAPAYCDFRGFMGEYLAEKNAPVRKLTLSGLHLLDKYIIVTTNFTEPAGENSGDFKNSAVDIIRAFGPDGNEIPLCYGRDYNYWTYYPPVEGRGCFEYGVGFDDAFGNLTVTLDEPKTNWRQGFVAITRGRNAYLPAALCESYPEVREHWLSMIKDALDAGADMIDFRIENHSSHTDDPFAYGYNDVVLDEYKKRYGDAPVDVVRIAEIRGEYYSQFLRDARKLVLSYGKKMHHHLNVDYFREDPPYQRRMAYPWNMRIEWEKWLDEGLLDEAHIRSHTTTTKFILNDPFSLRVIDMCKKRGVPMNINRYIFEGGLYNTTIESYEEDYNLIRAKGCFQSFVVYEVASLMTSDEKEGIVVKMPEMCETISKMHADYC